MFQKMHIPKFDNNFFSARKALRLLRFFFAQLMTKRSYDAPGICRPTPVLRAFQLHSLPAVRELVRTVANVRHERPVDEARNFVLSERQLHANGKHCKRTGGANEVLKVFFYAKKTF